MERNYNPIPLELLSPAGDLACGRAALSAGADAIYIGAPRFGARAAAGVSLQDIAQLVEEAHLFGAKVYVALNTILYPAELQEAISLIEQLYLVGVDALIIQDLGLLHADLPPIPLHASTQCHNATAEQLQRLAHLGFEQVVLARELSVEETAQLHAATPTLRLETFVHGALCVSYSGRCYLSQTFTQRSANRGACAQYCRLPYSLQDARGHLITQGAHLLSLKDLNRSALLRELIEAGATSFKIEGRLKSASYVRNITAYYHQLLNDFVAAHPTQYVRASQGEINLNFVPDPQKSFSRGATTYQLHKGPLSEVLIRPQSPKSEGEPLGKVTAIKGNRITLPTSAPEITAGDGLAFYTPQGAMEGTRVNKVLSPGVLMVDNPQNITRGTMLYRNLSQKFEQQINRPDSSTRVYPIRYALETLPWGFVLKATPLDSDAVEISVTIETPMEIAQKAPDISRIEEALSKLGGTPFVAQEVAIHIGSYFIPLSTVSTLKRKSIEALSRALRLHNLPHKIYRPHYSTLPPVLRPLQAEAQENIANPFAEKVYQSWGIANPQKAFELAPQPDMPLMVCKHCIRRYLGYCTRDKKRFPYTEPLYLIHGKERIRLQFDCQACVMKLYKA